MKKKSPLTQAQRKQAQRDRDKALLHSMNITSLEAIMKVIRHMKADERKGFSRWLATYTLVKQ